MTDRSRSRLRSRDAVSLGTLGLRTRKGRTAMAAIGIAIGVASLIALVGIINSGEADAQRDLLEQGIDVLELTPGTSFAEDPELLPDAAAAIDTHMRGLVEVVASIRRVPATLRKTDLIPEVETGGIRLFAVEEADLDLLIPLRGGVAAGRFHDAATVHVPTVVLGSDTAGVLGFDELYANPTVHISGHEFAVIGILDPFTISQGLTLNRAALIGFSVAEKLYDADANPERIWVQADLDVIEQVRELLPRQANPEAPGEVAVSSLDLEAREIISENFESLLSLLVVVIIVVGAIGVGNIMLISVLERRGEIGVRRALGAKKSHIAVQFLIESVLLTLFGGLMGIVLGLAVVAVATQVLDWPFTIEFSFITIGLAVTVGVGLVAGMYPSWRASRMDPAEAVRPAA
ncbi:MAG: ABC transporter permease [Acidimicrobiia bacterium]|nr:ABC transporter permease [Acidimicrobiia bacterium]MYG59829.1 ABC transporter permease [Acidimicrobiia bacterium]MYJ32766.1 ABC transporter permease [Acidimicrobiia bacterium]